MGHYKEICKFIVENIFETNISRVLNNFVKFFKELLKCEMVNIIIKRENTFLYIYKEFDIPDKLLQGEFETKEIKDKNVLIYKYIEKDTNFEIILMLSNYKYYNLEYIRILSKALLQVYKKNYIHVKDLEELESHISYTTDVLVNLRKSIYKLLKFAQDVINGIIYKKEPTSYLPVDRIMFLKEIFKEIVYVYIYVKTEFGKNILHYDFSEGAYKGEDVMLNELIEKCSIENRIVYKKDVGYVKEILIYKRTFNKNNFISLLLGFEKELKEKEVINLLVSFFAILFELEMVYRKYLNDLNKINELKTFLINNIAHEMLTPVTITKDLLRISLEEKDLNRKNLLIERAYNSVIRLKNIIEKVVKFVEIFRGRDIFEFEQININDIILIVLKEYEAIIREKRLIVNLNLEKIPDILGNYSMLKIAIRELIDNAIKFNKVGGKIEISTSEKDDSIFIKISDTGVGIERNKIDKLFDLFSHMERYETKKFPGIGIGLVLVKTIIEYHNGEILIKSEPGKGTDVIVELPKKIKFEM